MSGKRGFLEKQMKNRRFFKNENLILDIFIREYKNGITTKKIAKKAKLSRSTIYVHHHAIKEIIPDYERYILSLFSSTIKKKLHRRSTHLKTLYLEMLLFILRNKKIFKMFIKFDDREIIVKMIGKLNSKIISTVRLPKSSKKILKIYAGEVAELIFAWGRADFPKNELERVLSDIMYLTNTCSTRLTPINHEY